MAVDGEKNTEWEMKRILMLTDGIAPFIIGGMQKHSSGLIASLAQQGHDITVLHCVKSGMQRPTSKEVKEKLGVDEALPVEFRCFYFPDTGSLPGHYLRSSYLYSQKLFEHISGELSQFDFIYAKGFTAWHFIEQKKKGCKDIPLIGVKFHGYEMFQPGGSWKLRLQKYMLKGPTQWMNRNADYVFSYGGDITKVILDLGVNANKIIEIPTGIDKKWLREDKKYFDGPRRFLFIGRYERRKGIEELHHVISTTDFDLPIEFHFVGPIPASKRIKKEGVVYHGEIKAREELIKIIDQCHILLCPSHAEGMPNVIIEAMSRRLAVIATKVGAVEAMLPKQGGRIIAAGNEEELRRAVSDFAYADAKELQTMGEMSIEFIRTNLLWQIVGKVTSEKLESLS